MSMRAMTPEQLLRSFIREAIESRRGMWTNEEEDLDEIDAEQEEDHPDPSRYGKSHPTAHEI